MSFFRARTAFHRTVRWPVRFLGLHYLLTRELLDCGAAFNPLDRRYRSDPYPLYDRLRDKDPIHRSRLLNGYILTRYDDIAAALKEPKLSADERKRPDYLERRRAALEAGRLTEEEANREPSLLRLDPPDHTRLRSLVTRAFTPRAVEALRPRVEQLVEELLDQAASRDDFDIIRDLAYPLPLILIADMLGIPLEDRGQFKRWSDEAARVIDFSTSPEGERRAREASRHLWRYLRRIAEERRREPREDLLSALLAAQEEGDELTLDEVFATCELLLVAGNETTTNLIGNGMLALLQRPGQVEALRHDPELTQSAIEELLRFDTPVQATSRLALEDFDFRGVPIRRGQILVLFFGAGNRDPEQFERPNDLDVHRSDIRHLSFGQGIHYCLGAPLARIEAPIAINALLRRFPNLRLSSRAKPHWGDGLILHGLHDLPVEY